MADTQGNSQPSYYVKYRDGLPVLSKTVSIFILLLNIFFPGIGTMLLSCIGGQFVIDHLVIGILQFITAPCIIGWVWSILWGILLVMKSA